MKLFPPIDRRFRSASAPDGGERGFTMVEIALCLGVIAIALVAIIGVMPTGVRVQRENQEETIINQDARLLLEAIRSGASGMNYLTNYFESITLVRSLGNSVVYSNQFLERAQLTNGLGIMGLLSNPKYLQAGNRVFTNKVTARVRAISGSAIEKSQDPKVRDIAFRYRLTSELVPLSVFPRELTNFTVLNPKSVDWGVASNNWLMARNQATNFHELRLTLQGPMIARGNNFEVYGTPRTFRTLVSGRLDRMEFPTDGSWPRFWLIQPDAYAKVNP
jgi:type II secretory pathway pseudopilin PulG